MLRSGDRHREATPEHTDLAAEEVPAAVWHPVWVAIYEGDGAFRHWVLFVEDEQDAGKSFIVHVQGSSGRFRYEQRRSNAHASRSVVEIIQVGHVHEDNLRRFREISREVEVKNQDPTWNCQDFVWSALEAIAADGLIDVEDELYTTGRQTVWARMEGLA